MKAADPGLSEKEFSIKIVEVNGAPVTHVVIVAEVEFGHEHAVSGRVFAQLLGVQTDGLPSTSDVPESSSAADPFEMSLSAIVIGPSKGILDDDRMSLMKLHARFKSAIMESIMQARSLLFRH